MLNYKGLATLLFGGTVDKYSNISIFAITKNNLPKADIKTAFRTYMSTVLLSCVLIYFISLFVLFFALKVVVVTTLMKTIYMIFVPLLNAIAAFVILSFYPYQKALSRRRNIETNLPFVLTHMGAVVASGVPPYVVFRLISEFEEYGEVSKEMRKIIRNVDTFGIDPMTAVKQVAERTPSEDLKQILSGFVTTTESGGDVKLFLKNAGQQALFEWRIKREKFLQQLSAYAEFYVGILIAAPLFIIALFSVMNMISPTMGGYNILDLMKMSIYLIVPVLNIGFLLFIRGMEVEM